MKSIFTNFCLCMLLILWIVPAYAQNAELKSVGDAVYATYKEKGVDKAIESYQILKKKNAKDYKFDESELNRIAYQVMNKDNDAQAAKKIFWLNMEEYPEAVNPKDSYGDVLLRLGEKEEARKYFANAVETQQKSGSFERNVARNAKAKMAILDGKHQAFNFLTGTWNTTNTHWNEVNKEYKDTGEATFSYLNNMVLVGEMKQQRMANDEVRGPVWVISYNAQKDGYETAWIDPSMRGLMNSTLKFEEKEGEKYILTEEFTEEDDRYVLRHEIRPQANTVQWEIFLSKNGQEFRKSDQIEMSKMDITKK